MDEKLYQRITDFLEPRILDRSCPICGSSEWAAIPEIMSSRTFHLANDVSEPKQYPLVVAVCLVCNTMQSIAVSKGELPKLTGKHDE